MNGRVVLIGIVISLSFFAFHQERITAQDKDSLYLQSVQDSVERFIRTHPLEFKPKENRLKVLPLFGANYSKESGFGILTGCLGQYKSGVNLNNPFSSAALLAYISTNLTLIGAVNWNHIFPEGKFRINYDFKIARQEKHFWGLGFENNDNNENIGNYLEEGVTTSASLLYSPNEYILTGPKVGFKYRSAKEFSKPELINGHKPFSRAFCAGLFFRYDSRDDKITPSNGFLIEATQDFFFSLDSFNYYNSAITIDYFLPIWKDAVLAFDLFSEFNYGDSPWTEWVQMGGDTRMRGYYFGRYRDRNLISFQTEIRQNFGDNHGIVIWGGAGNIFHDINSFEFTNTLPTYGIGYRFKFFSYLLRADFGVGKWGQYAFSIGINHAF